MRLLNLSLLQDYSLTSIPTLSVHSQIFLAFNRKYFRPSNNSNFRIIRVPHGGINSGNYGGVYNCICSGFRRPARCWNENRYKLLCRQSRNISECKFSMNKRYYRDKFCRGDSWLRLFPTEVIWNVRSAVLIFRNPMNPRF